MKNRFFFGIILFSFSCFAYEETSVLGKEIEIKEDFNNQLSSILYSIHCSIKSPMFVESNEPSDKNISLNLTKGKLSDILDNLCKILKGHSYHVKDGVIFIQQDSLIKEIDYPVDKLKFPENINTEDVNEYVNSEKFLMDFIKTGIFIDYVGGWNFEGVRSYKKESSKMTLREVIADFLVSGKTWCWVDKWEQNEKDEYLKFLDNSKYKSIVPKGNFYSLSIMHGYAEISEIQDAKEKPRSSISRVKVEDGRKLLKIDSIFKVKGKTLTVSLENSSDKDIFFKEFKNNLLVAEGYIDKKAAFGSNLRMLFPSENEKMEDSFAMKPGEKKELSIRLDVARCKTGFNKTMWDVGDEEESDIETIPFKQLEDLGKYEYFRPIIYFYDKEGVKYKSSGHEALER